ncbi:MAG: serine hydrolase [Microcoleaceae cyanobacterium]
MLRAIRLNVFRTVHSFSRNLLSPSDRKVHRRAYRSTPRHSAYTGISRPPVQYRRHSRKKSARLLVLLLMGIVAGAISAGLFTTLRSKPISGSSDAPESLVTRKQYPVYNIPSPPNFIPSEALQTIVDGAVELVQQQGLPTSQLSISLIDVSQPHYHTHAGHNHELLRYPASVAKLFWAVLFLDLVETGVITDESAFYVDLSNMMRVSDNDSASRVVDAITQTESGTTLEGKALETWLYKRDQLNRFFQDAGYEDIRLSMKNYPAPNLGPMPTGRDQQLWSESEQSGGNQVTTDQAARLMYEVYTQQAISPLASTKIVHLLTRNLDPVAWQEDELNSVEGFFSESLPTNLYFGSKIGYTRRSRQEVAFIKTSDNRTAYILAVFGTDPAYAENEDIFPELSRYIFDRLNGVSPVLPPEALESN